MANIILYGVRPIITEKKKKKRKKEREEVGLFCYEPISKLYKMQNAAGPEILQQQSLI